MVFGNLKNISGVRSMLLGLGTGKLASISAKAIDNAINNKKEQKTGSQA